MDHFKGVRTLPAEKDQGLNIAFDAFAKDGREPLHLPLGILDVLGKGLAVQRRKNLRQPIARYEFHGLSPGGHAKSPSISSWDRARSGLAVSSISAFRRSAMPSAKGTRWNRRSGPV